MTDSRLRGRLWLRVISAAIVLGIIAIQVPILIEASARPNWNGYGGIDLDLYLTATRRWLETGVFYEPHQLAGPYKITHGDILYPPVALWLFVPFTILPSVLWWVIPIGVTTWVIWRLRPSPLSWPLMAAVLGWQPVQIHFISGNPVMWAMMFLALGTLYYWPAVFVFLKPSLGIFALFGSWDRRWWFGVVAFAMLSVPFLLMWFNWLTVVFNAQGGGLLYSWQEAPMMFLPLIAWAARPGSRYGIERRGLPGLHGYGGPERRAG